MANEYNDVIRVWAAKAADALKNKILVKQWGGTTDTFEIAGKDPSGNMMYCPSDKTPVATFLDLSVVAWSDNRILYGNGVQASSFVYITDMVGLGTTGTPFTNVAVAGANFTGKGLHVKNTTNPAYLILESLGAVANGSEAGFGAGRIIFGGNNSAAADSKLMQIIGGGNHIQFQGLDDNGDVISAQEKLFAIHRTGLYSDLLKSTGSEHNVNDGWIRSDINTGEIYAQTPA